MNTEKAKPKSSMTDSRHCTRHHETPVAFEFSVFICVHLCPTPLRRFGHGILALEAHFAAGPEAEAVEVDVDRGRGVEREELAHEQASHDRDAERAAQLRAVARAERERDRRQ